MHCLRNANRSSGRYDWKILWSVPLFKGIYLHPFEEVTIPRTAPQLLREEVFESRKMVMAIWFSTASYARVSRDKLPSAAHSVRTVRESESLMVCRAEGISHRPS
jgi:hypothetical protein